MNTLKVDKTSHTRKAWIAFVAAISCLSIYIMACVVSPPAWSPDSSKIAILVSPPGEEPDRFALFTYDIAADTHTLLDEVEADGILSAPSWSPDGKWIAYYKVEQPPEEIAKSESNVAEPNQLPNREPVPTSPEGTAEPAAELFSEDDLMLPSFISEILKEEFDEEDAETLDVKLIIVSPDGKNKRVLAVMKWIVDDDIRSMLVYMRPVWSPDCNRLFYVRGLEDLFYVSSLELATGETAIHILSSIGTPVLSHDGKWVASYMKDNDTLTAARIDGGLSKYFRLSFEVESEGLLMVDGIFWSKDLKRLFVVDTDTALHAIDVATGTTEGWIAPDPNYANAYYTQSSARDRLYFITGFETEEETSEQQTFTLKHVSLKNKSTGSIFQFQFPEISEDGEGGRFSISPDGKLVLMRSIIDDEDEEDRSVLVFYDGKTKKVVRTDHWLLKPLYDDSSLTFDEKLIGKWREEDNKITIAKGPKEGTYKITWTDGEEDDQAVANLVKIKGEMFLALFLDESALDGKDASGLHLFPDMFMRIVQIEPKLILQTVEYDELDSVLKEATDSFRPEDFGDEDTVELERVQP